MRYMLLLFGDEKIWASMTPDQAAQGMAAYFAYTEELKKAGKLVSGDELQPTSTAKTVKIDGGKRRVVDGPYVDIKEALGGYYLIEADSEAEALEWAAKCPAASHGSVEVRPIVMR
ncbi:MAG: YciI family protein [Hyphomonadaceae bacterium]|nr:YciI family protein [Hyphomonadaceae bacterium]